MKCCLIPFQFLEVHILHLLKMFSGGYKMGTFGKKKDLNTKYNNKFIWTCLDKLTFKIIHLLQHIYILCSPFGKGFCMHALIMYQRCFYGKGEDICKSSLFPKKASLTIKWNKKILSDRSLRPKIHFWQRLYSNALHWNHEHIF